MGGSGPSTVVGQTGEYKRVVEWIKQAWIDIQTRHIDWNFMRGTFTLTTVNGTAEYAASDASLTDLDFWPTTRLKIYATSTSDETDMDYVSYDEFFETYMLGSIGTGRPFFYTITPDNKLRMYPTPDTGYTVYGDYYKQPTTLAANSDVPACKARYHQIIVWHALLKYARYEAATEVVNDAMLNFRRMMSQMERTELPDMGVMREFC
jgi:hypothetical protein